MSPDPGKEKGDIRPSRGSSLTSYSTRLEVGEKGSSLTSRRVAVAIERARAAVLGLAPPPPAVQEEAVTPPAVSEALHVPLPRVAPCQRPQEAPVPLVWPSAMEVLAGRKLSRGGLRLFLFLHRLKVDMAAFRGYRMIPDQITTHLPAVSIAGVLDYHPDHVARLGRELERAGVLDCGGHVQKVAGSNLYDGTLWCLKMRPDAPAPRVQADEWRYQWRPGFAADLENRTGAAAEMSGLRAEGASVEERYQAAKARAAVPDGVFSPATPSPDNATPAGLRGVVEALPGVWSAHPRHRAREVGRLASAMSRALNEPERRRYWCRVLWDAFAAEVEGRAGGLRALGAQIARLAADVQEGAPWRNPGAVLAARLKVATC